MKVSGQFYGLRFAPREKAFTPLMGQGVWALDTAEYSRAFAPARNWLSIPWSYTQVALSPKHIIA
jgi:hypothetical protein